MHPDAIIAALRDELEKVPSEDTDRREQIEQEIAYTDSLPRPAVKPGDGSTTVADATRVYYDALHQELVNEPEERKAEIREEIARTETQLKSQAATKQPASAAVEETAEETEDLEQLSKAELAERVAAAGLEVPKRASKGDLVELLTATPDPADHDLANDTAGERVQIDIDPDGDGSAQVDGTTPEAITEPALLGEIAPDQTITPCEGTVTVTAVDGQPDAACINVTGAPAGATVVVQYSEAEAE